MAAHFGRFAAAYRGKSKIMAPKIRVKVTVLAKVK
jgi:hypothetical protein